MWNYHNPVAVHAGVGSLARLPGLLAGRRALLLTFPDAAALGLEQAMSALLGTQLAGIENAVLPNPDVAWLEDMYQRLWQQHADVPCIVALGGGSVIDCAKAMLAPTPTGRFAPLLGHLRDGTAFAPEFSRLKSLIALPTTAGTGSEVTPWATIWDTAAGRKYSLHQPWTWPEAAIIDATLMRDLPVAATLASGLDALSHAFESIWNINRNPVSSTLAVAAARRILATLPQLLRAPYDIALREQMALAALQAGLAFSNTRTALAHSLSYDITLQTGLAHGIACSFSLPHVLRLALGRDAGVDALLLQILDATDGEQAAARLTAFLEALGVPTDPAHYGLAGRWEASLQLALQGPRGRNFIAAGVTPH
ncbi:MAG: iron-containing alcohol dehydrogenase [Herbaspirillum sp.]|nr:iron-containing alcohol dehydrogenase [Herbaspirillum sp.]